jgi:putative sterol carrier protein
MTDRTQEFFDRLGSQPQPLLSQVTATIRVDLDDDRNATKHWYLDIDKGRVDVSQRNNGADAVIQTHRTLFERMVTGEANALTATLRGQLGIEGDPKLMVAFQRLMPGPPRANIANLPTKGRDR